MTPEQTWTAAKAVAAERGIEWTLPDELPKPVDPQLEAFREWAAAEFPDIIERHGCEWFESYSDHRAFGAGAAYVRGLPQETFDEALAKSPAPDSSRHWTNDDWVEFGFKLARGEVGK